MTSATFLRPPHSIGCALVSLLVATRLSAQPAFTEQGASILSGANFDARSASLADFDGDGADLLAWQRQLGNGASASTAAVPQPTAALLLFVVAPGIVRWRITRSGRRPIARRASEEIPVLPMSGREVGSGGQDPPYSSE